MESLYDKYISYQGPVKKIDYVTEQHWYSP